MEISTEQLDRAALQGPVIGASRESNDDSLSRKISTYRTSSLFIFEKLWLILDYMQIYGIIWTAAQPYPWPYQWLTWTRWLIYSNADYFGLTFNGALMGRTDSLKISPIGTMPGYLNYALYMSIIPAVVMFVPIALTPLFNSYGKRLDLYKAPVLKWVFFTLQFLYVPCTLVLFRLFFCYGNRTTLSHEKVLGVDPDIACGSSSHIMYTVVCGFLVFPLTIGLPIFLYRLIHRSVIYSNNADHEKRLQLWELLYILNLDDYWSDAQLWLLSSFKLRGAYFRVNILIYKFTLLFIFIAFRVEYYIQATIMWFATLAFFALIGKERPYRLKSTNAIYFACNCLLFIDVSTAGTNAFGVQNSILVASTESIWLLAIHLFGMIFMGGVVISSYVNPFDTWPINRTLRRIENSVAFERISYWIELIREAHAIQLNSLVQPIETVDFFIIEDTVRRVRKEWLSARSIGSLFETPLSEALDSLLLIHSNLKISKQAYRKNIYWDNTYLDLGTNMSVRHRQRGLIREGKRGILLKLLAAKAFMDRGKYKPNYDQQNEYLEGKGRRDEETGLNPVISYAFGDLEHNSSSMHFTEEHMQRMNQEITKMLDSSEKLLHKNPEELAANPDMLRNMIELSMDWDEIVWALEHGELPGSHLYTSNDFEDWYTYRKLVNSRIALLDSQGLVEKLRQDILAGDHLHFGVEETKGPQLFEHKLEALHPMEEKGLRGDTVPSMMSRSKSSSSANPISVKKTSFYGGSTGNLRAIRDKPRSSRDFQLSRGSPEKPLLPVVDEKSRKPSLPSAVPVSNPALAPISGPSVRGIQNIFQSVDEGDENYDDDDSEDEKLHLLKISPRPEKQLSAVLLSRKASNYSLKDNENEDLEIDLERQMKHHDDTWDRSFDGPKKPSQGFAVNPLHLPVFDTSFGNDSEVSLIVLGDSEPSNQEISSPSVITHETRFGVELVSETKNPLGNSPRQEDLEAIELNQSKPEVIVKNPSLKSFASGKWTNALVLDDIDDDEDEESSNERLANVTAFSPEKSSNLSHISIGGYDSADGPSNANDHISNRDSSASKEGLFPLNDEGDEHDVGGVKHTDEKNEKISVISPDRFVSNEVHQSSQLGPNIEELNQTSSTDLTRQEEPPEEEDLRPIVPTGSHEGRAWYGPPDFVDDETASKAYSTEEKM